MVVAAGAARARGKRGRHSRCNRHAAVARCAEGWRSASVAGGAPASELLAALPPGGAEAAGAAVLLVPRARAGELQPLVAAVEAALGAGVSVVGALTGAERLSLVVAPGGAVASLGSASLPQDLDSFAAAAAGAAVVLMLADPAVPPANLSGAWSGLEARLPGASKIGAIVAPPGAKGQPAVGGLKGALRAGGIVAVALGGSAAMDVCTYQPFGPELEVFEASLPRSGPCVVQTIGTDEAGSWDDVEETEKGTAGIARRVSVPAARAIQDAMKEAGVSGPKEVFFGVPGSATSGGAPVETLEGKQWSLFPWAGMNKDGSVVLGGKGPVAEGLCPKGSLSWMRCFRPVIGPEAASMRLAAASKASGGKGPLVLASAGAPPGAVKELVQADPSSLVLVGSSLIGAPAGGAAGGPVQGRAVGVVAP